MKIVGHCKSRFSFNPESQQENTNFIATTFIKTIQNIFNDDYNFFILSKL